MPRLRLVVIGIAASLFAVVACGDGGNTNALGDGRPGAEPPPSSKDPTASPSADASTDTTHADAGTESEARPVITFHEPTGFTRIAEINFDSLPASGVVDMGGAGILAGSFSLFGSGKIVSDPTARTSGPNVFEFLYPVGIEGGSGPALVHGWNGPNTSYRAIYERGWVRIPSADFEGPTLGTTDAARWKIGGYWGVGKLGGEPDGQVYAALEATNLKRVSADWTWMWVTQGPATVATVNDNQVFFPNKGPGIFKCGDWHVYEVVMEVNDIGVQNGKITAWIDGVQSHEHTNVAFVTAARPNGFSGRALNPVWGGLGTPKTREDRVYWDHLVISGKL